MKAQAAALIAARSAMLNAQDDLRRAKQAYIAAEAAYIDGLGENSRGIVFQNVAITLRSMWPDSKDGEHLEFENVEVVS